MTVNYKLFDWLNIFGRASTDFIIHWKKNEKLLVLFPDVGDLVPARMEVPVNLMVFPQVTSGGIILFRE